MKLLLVDGSALLHRAYHAYPPLTTKDGEVVGAVYGVASILITALQTISPTHVAVAWDLPKPTFRHEKYVGYKAQRPKADLEMVEQIPRVKEIIGAMGIVQIAHEGFEADDIIGTLSKNQQGEVVILTGDQDTMQLVDEQVKVMTPAKGRDEAKIYGPEQVLAKYGVRPNQIVDFKALVGDASDNIPGVAGIGPKSAANLIQEFGSLGSIYQNLEKIPEKMRLRLKDGQDSAFLSQELSLIITEMPITEKIEEMEYKGVDKPTLKEELEKLGFKSLLRRIFPGTEETKKKVPDNQMGLF